MLRGSHPADPDSASPFAPFPFAPPPDSRPLKVGRVKRAKYSTSLDSRGYIPVYEYSVDDHPIMWDRETGDVHFTGIWKALGRSKSDIVKMVDANPALHVKKIRGGLLKIQGTWISRDEARILARRTCFPLRHQLVPLFGPGFPDECLLPSQPGYGSLLLDGGAPLRGKRRRRSDAGMERVDSGTGIADPAGFAPAVLSPPPPAKRRKSSSPRGMEILLNDHDALSSASPPLLSEPRSRSFSSSSVSSSSNSSLGHDDQPYLADHRPAPALLKHSDAPVAFVPTAKYVGGFSPYPSALPDDLRDTLMASVLLQRLSQDTGERPFRPCTLLPRTIHFGGQVYQVVWSE
ncbi:uncharacterized protein VTP21DRAFT_11218 [Calcarisporiella thermophila]|uniref:uncharacterized protein n=1 Tax=Calcarisporiella thermophila TaxID=911321 RepID=UPI0037445FA4